MNPIIEFDCIINQIPQKAKFRLDYVAGAGFQGHVCRAERIYENDIRENALGESDYDESTPDETQYCIKLCDQDAAPSRRIPYLSDAQLFEELKEISAFPYFRTIYAMNPETEQCPACVLLEHVEGKTLEEYLMGGHPLSTKLHILRQVLKALTYLHHHGIFHGNISLTNLLVRKQSTYEELEGFLPRICLIDFSSANYVGSRAVDKNRTLPVEASPEAELDIFDNLADVYACGRLLCSLIRETEIESEGGISFTWNRMPGIDAGPVRDALAYVIRKACAWQPEERYSSVYAMLQDVEAIQDALARQEQPVKEKDNLFSAPGEKKTEKVPYLNPLPDVRNVSLYLKYWNKGIHPYLPSAYFAGWLYNEEDELKNRIMERCGDEEILCIMEEIFSELESYHKVRIPDAVRREAIQMTRRAHSVHLFGIALIYTLDYACFEVNRRDPALQEFRRERKKTMDGLMQHLSEWRGELGEYDQPEYSRQAQWREEWEKGFSALRALVEKVNPPEVTVEDLYRELSRASGVPVEKLYLY